MNSLINKVSARKAVLGLSAAAVALVALNGAAQAKPSFSFGLHFGGGHVTGVYGGYGYPKKCYWLKKKAKKTGSHYWWSRYNKCMNFYYY